MTAKSTAIPPTPHYLSEERGESGSDLCRRLAGSSEGDDGRVAVSASLKSLRSLNFRAMSELMESEKVIEEPFI